MRQRYGFLLIPRFSLLSLAAVTDVIRVANEILGGRAMESLLLSQDGRPVASAAGETVNVHAALAAPPGPSLAGLFVVADSPPESADLTDLKHRLRSSASEIERARGVLGGLGSGAAWLARVGLLDGYRCTVRAVHAAEVAAACPEAIVSLRHFEIDRNRLSAAGGGSGIDLMIHWLGQRHGERLTRLLLAHFGLDRLRDSDERQALPNAARPNASAKLSEAVALMEANLGEPLSTEDIASLVGVSRRQLERLFKQHLDTLPSRWYLEQRLQRAQRLLQQTSQSILQIGLGCGFTSGAHFSNAYRNCFGRTPRDERSARANAWRNAPRDNSSLDASESNEDRP